MGQVGVYPQTVQYPIITDAYVKETYRRAGKWHIIADKYSILSASNMTANRLFFMPWVLQRRTEIGGIGWRVGTGVAGARIYWGLYSDVDTYPGGLLASGDVAATANRNYVAAVSLVLEPGLRWLAVGSNLTPGVNRIDVTENIVCLGVDDFTNGGTDGQQIRLLYDDLADITLGLPDPAPAGLTESTGVGYFWATYLKFVGYP